MPSARAGRRSPRRSPSSTASSSRAGTRSPRRKSGSPSSTAPSSRSTICSASGLIPTPLSSRFWINTLLDYEKEGGGDDSTLVADILNSLTPQHPNVTYMRIGIEVTFYGTKSKKMSIRLLRGQSRKSLILSTDASVTLPDLKEAVRRFVDSNMADVKAFLAKTAHEVVLLRSDWRTPNFAHALVCVVDRKGRTIRIIDPSGGDTNQRNVDAPVSPLTTLYNVCSTIMACADEGNIVVDKNAKKAPFHTSLGKTITNSEVFQKLDFRIPQCSGGIGKGGNVWTWNNTLGVGNTALGGNCQWIQLYIIMRILCEGSVAMTASYWKKVVNELEHYATPHTLQGTNDGTMHQLVADSFLAFNRQLFVKAFVSGIVELLPLDVKRKYVKRDVWVVVDPKTMTSTNPMTPEAIAKANGSLEFRNNSIIPMLKGKRSR